MKFLLNGCSFCANYWLASKLATQLGYDEFTSLAKGGRSNRQLIRTTLEYIEKNSVDFVLIGLSFWDRFEGSFLKPELNVDNWVNYRKQGVQSGYIPENPNFNNDNSSSDIDRYIGTKYQYEINLKTIDQQMCDLVMFSSYLKTKNVKYLIYNSCETNYDLYFDTVSPFYKKIIESNPRIIPLNKFISNLFLLENGATWDPVEDQWPPHAKHYGDENYIHLNNYLLKYIKDNGL
jgi:hypothetical protein